MRVIWLTWCVWVEVQQTELPVCEEEGGPVVVGVEGPVGQGGGTGQTHYHHRHLHQVHGQAGRRTRVRGHQPDNNKSRSQRGNTGTGVDTKAICVFSQ